MIELLSNTEMAEADRLAIAGGTPGIQLMEHGGDGFIAARLLASRGYRVRVMLVGEAQRLKGDAAIASGRWSGPLAPADPAALIGNGDVDLVIDALFGAWLDRPVE